MNWKSNRRWWQMKWIVRLRTSLCVDIFSKPNSVILVYSETKILRKSISNLVNVVQGIYLSLKKECQIMFRFHWIIYFPLFYQNLVTPFVKYHIFIVKWISMTFLSTTAIFTIIIISTVDSNFKKYKQTSVVP